MIFECVSHLQMKKKIQELFIALKFKKKKPLFLANEGSQLKIIQLGTGNNSKSLTQVNNMQCTGRPESSALRSINQRTFLTSKSDN